MTLQPSLSLQGRLGRGPFAVAVIVLYLASFASQALLSAPVTARIGVYAFVVVQAVLIWLWVVLHRRRLRDAGRTTGLAIGIAIVYALQAALWALLTGILVSEGARTGDPNNPAAILHLFMALYLIGVTTGESQLLSLQYWLMGFGVLMLLPIVAALVFSIWAGTRPSAAPGP